jgi:hypothetical protein
MISAYMYACVMRNATQVRRFTITDNTPSGWEVCEEHDNMVIRRVRYDDWHRVERAKMAFARIAIALKEAGWEEN